MCLSCRQVGKICHPIGKTLPPRWQNFAIGMAKVAKSMAMGWQNYSLADNELT